MDTTKDSKNADPADEPKRLKKEDDISSMEIMETDSPHHH